MRSMNVNDHREEAYYFFYLLNTLDIDLKAHKKENYRILLNEDKLKQKIREINKDKNLTEEQINDISQAMSTMHDLSDLLKHYLENIQDYLHPDGNISKYTRNYSVDNEIKKIEEFQKIILTYPNHKYLNDDLELIINEIFFADESLDDIVEATINLKGEDFINNSAVLKSLFTTNGEKKDPADVYKYALSVFLFEYRTYLVYHSENYRDIIYKYKDFFKIYGDHISLIYILYMFEYIVFSIDGIISDFIDNSMENMNDSFKLALNTFDGNIDEARNALYVQIRCDADIMDRIFDKLYASSSNFSSYCYICGMILSVLIPPALTFGNATSTGLLCDLDFNNPNISEKLYLITFFDEDHYNIGLLETTKFNIMMVNLSEEEMNDPQIVANVYAKNKDKFTFLYEFDNIIDTIICYQLIYSYCSGASFDPMIEIKDDITVLRTVLRHYMAYNGYVISSNKRVDEMTIDELAEELRVFYNDGMITLSPDEIALSVGTENYSKYKDLFLQAFNNISMTMSGNFDWVFNESKVFTIQL